MRRPQRRRSGLRRRQRRGFAAKALIVSALAFTGWQWGHAAIIQGKAWLAPILIERAWAESRQYRVDVKPWPWADTWPIAKLSVPALGIEQYVLAGANGAALPFGPGHVAASAAPGERGTVVIAGHRDTHFAFLPRLEAGSIVVLESVDGAHTTYTVSHKAVVDVRDGPLRIASESAALVLITCEPDRAFTARGPYRLLIFAL